jgi:hypothetical protein
MALTMLGYPPHVEARDHETGFQILGRPADRPRDVSPTAVAWDALVGAAVGSVGVLVLLSFGGLFLLDAIGVSSVTVGRPGTVTFLFAYVNTPTEIPVQVGAGVPVLGASLGLLYSFARSFRRSGRPAGDATGGQ